MIKNALEMCKPSYHLTNRAWYNTTP